MRVSESEAPRRSVCTIGDGFWGGVTDRVDVRFGAKGDAEFASRSTAEIGAKATLRPGAIWSVLTQHCLLVHADARTHHRRSAPSPATAKADATVTLRLALCGGFACHLLVSGSIAVRSDAGHATCRRH
jgi:hypothetical protein